MKMGTLLWFLVFGILMLFRTEYAHGLVMQNIYVSGCNNETIHMKCPPKHKIAIKRVFYGAKLDRQCSRLGRKLSPECCERVQGDCIDHNSDIYTSLNIRCSGYRDCHYDITSIKATRVCRVSKDSKSRMTDFMTAVYDCIPDTDIAQLCTNDMKKGKQLYLSNLNYPDPIRGGNQVCQCFVKTEFSEGISINVIDIMITMPEKSNTCPQRLRITDTYKTKSISCGQAGMFGFRNFYTRMVSNVTVVLDSRTDERRGYVWLQLKTQSLDDNVMIYCGQSMDRLLYGPPTTPHANLTAAGGLHPKIIPDMIAIIAGVSGAVALVLIICIVAIAVHCTRERERLAYPKVPEVIPSPMVRGKIYHPDDKDATHQRYNYDEDRYCSIKRCPVKMTKMSDVDSDADQQLKEAFLQINDHNPHQYTNGKVQGVAPRPRSPEKPLLSEQQAPDYKSVDKFYTMNLQKPQTEVAEIRVTSSLPQRGKVKKAKTVTFSPVAMVTPLPSGSEESIGSEGDRNLANIIDTYQSLRGDQISPTLEKNRKAIIKPTENNVGFASIEGPNADEIAEMQELWKTLGEVQDSTTMDEGAYDNIDYLLAQNRAKHHDMI